MKSSKSVIPQRPAPELLAPAGNLECARAAVENGANAIYFGLEAGFNARARADNMTVEQLPELMSLLHGRNVKGYVTLNTLAFTDELPRLQKYVRILAAEGVDAVLVQDVGVARMVREICPDLEIHASTQMTLTHAIAIEMVRQLGIQRVVLARELSLKEIRKIASQTTMPLEVFVHGALCVAYSGQCLTSESLGGRSANRGQCAQACRLPYDLICDEQEKQLGDVRYLLSPQDLAAYPLISELVDAGVASLKIEGRLKTPEYVANIVGNYRQAIDRALAGKEVIWSDEQKRKMELSFSRGFSPGWLEGNDHKRLVPGKSSAKRGVKVGTVVESRRDRLVVDLQVPLAKGDGVVLEGGRLEDREIGGRVFQIFKSGQSQEGKTSGRVELAFAHGLLNDADVFPGQALWQTDDPQLSRQLKKTYQGSQPHQTLPVHLKVDIVQDQALTVEATCLGRIVRWTSDFVPPAARKHPVSEAVLGEQLGRMGGSRFHLESVKARIKGEPMVPLSILGQARREILQDLGEQFTARPRVVQSRDVLTECFSAAAQMDLGPANNVANQQPTLRVLCRNLQQLEWAMAAGADSLIADFHDVRQYRDAVRMGHEAGIPVALASLRILKPGEEGLLKAMVRQQADRWLVRNLVAARYAMEHEIPFDVDFSLNITNPLSAGWWRQQGARTLTPSYDLNRDQLLEMVAQVPASWLEVVVHQHMPLFHMEHCVFCSVLSPGTNKTNCGRPCDRHSVQLRDRVGAKHPLQADIGCRNTLYNAQAQSGAEAVAPLLDCGIQQFRIELLQESNQQSVARLVELYRQLAHGQIQGAEVWRTLKADNRVGVTRGTLEQPRNPLAIL